MYPRDCVDRSEVHEVAFNPNPSFQTGGSMFCSHHHTRLPQPPPPPYRAAHPWSKQNRTIPVNYAGSFTSWVGQAPTSLHHAKLSTLVDILFQNLFFIMGIQLQPALLGITLYRTMCCSTSEYYYGLSVSLFGSLSCPAFDFKFHPILDIMIIVSHFPSEENRF